MTDYAIIDDIEVAQDQPATQSLFSRLRDNPIAIAEGAAGAPRIQPKAIYQIAFSARSSANQVIGLTNAQVLFQTEQFDTKNCYSENDARFTPTKPGAYSLTVFAKYTSDATLAIRKNGTPIATLNGGQSLTVLASANGTTDYFDVLATYGTNPLTVDVGAFFQGFMIAAL